MPAVAAAVVVVVAAVTTLILTAGDPLSVQTTAGSGSAVTTSDTPTSTSETSAPSVAPPETGTASTSTHTATPKSEAPPPAAPPTLWVYDSGPVPPYHSLIASTDNWAGTDFGAEGARHNPISVAPDNAGGLRTTWTGGSPGQVYVQNVADARDLRSYVEGGGALVFDTVVHKPPADRTKVAVHCIYPCVSEVEATRLFRDLPVEQKTTVKIPLSCFTAKGLNAAMVNTPFLVYTAGALRRHVLGHPLGTERAGRQPAMHGPDLGTRLSGRDRVVRGPHVRRQGADERPDRPVNATPGTDVQGAAAGVQGGRTAGITGGAGWPVRVDHGAVGSGRHGRGHRRDTLPW